MGIGGTATATAVSTTASSAGIGSSAGINGAANGAAHANGAHHTGGVTPAVVRQSGVQSEAVREKGDWDELFFQCTKKTLRSETWEHAKTHRRNVSNFTI